MLTTCPTNKGGMQDRSSVFCLLIPLLKGSLSCLSSTVSVTCTAQSTPLPPLHTHTLLTWASFFTPPPQGEKWIQIPPPLSFFFFKYTVGTGQTVPPTRQFDLSLQGPYFLPWEKPTGFLGGCFKRALKVLSYSYLKAILKANLGHTLGLESPTPYLSLQGEPFTLDLKTK